MSEAKENPFELTNDWFEQTARREWDSLIPRLNPGKILEIGSYEGASACYLISKLGSLQNLEIHCIDSWMGGAGMQMVEARFAQNVRLAMDSAQQKIDLIVHKGMSYRELAKLVCENREDYFDFVYVDGSHMAPDVLSDAVLAFRLLRVGGIMAFDDYLWFDPPYGKDPLRSPKPAIDAFVNLHFRKVKVMDAPLRQVYVTKISN